MVERVDPSHDAFFVHVCYDNIKKFKITAIENWGSHRVVVGGSDGSIRVVEGDEDLTNVTYRNMSLFIIYLLFVYLFICDLFICDLFV